MVKTSIHPHLASGEITQWLQKLTGLDLCEKTAGRLLKMVQNPTKMTLLELESLMRSTAATIVQSHFTAMEGNQFAYMHAYRNLQGALAALRDPLTESVKAEIRGIAQRAPKSASQESTAAPAAATGFVDHSDERGRAMLNHSIVVHHLG